MEVERTPDSDVCLKVDNYEYHFTIRELMKTSRTSQYQESIDLANRVMAKSITTEMIFTGIMHIRQESARLFHRMLMS